VTDGGVDPPSSRPRPVVRAVEVAADEDELHSFVASREEDGLVVSTFGAVNLLRPLKGGVEGELGGDLKGGDRQRTQLIGVHQRSGSSVRVTAVTTGEEETLLCLILLGIQLIVADLTRHTQREREGEDAHAGREKARATVSDEGGEAAVRESKARVGVTRGQQRTILGRSC
jgi:hypothetical protein